MSLPRRLLPQPIITSQELRRNSLFLLRKPAKYACDTCHQRKVKCDRKRPECSECSRQSSVCKWSRRKTVVTTARDERSQQIAEIIDSLPEHEAAEILQGIVARQNTAVSGLPKQLSEHDVIRNSLLLPTQNNVEFELNVRHPVAYPPLYPIQVANLSLETLLGPSRMTRPRPARQCSSFRGLDTFGGTSHDAPARPASLIREFACMSLFRNRLKDVKIEIWTDVRIENELAIRVISFWLEVDYPLIPLFNADLFIEDLALGRHWFCSKLLVNAMMCWACQAYTPFHPSSMPSLSVAFFNEANKALERESRHLNTLTTCAALQLLCLSATGLGLDNDAIMYLRDSVKVGKAMGLFGVHSESESANIWLADDDQTDWRRAASYTAWGVFNWVVLHGRHYNILEIETAPLIPLPGTFNDSQTGQAGSTVIQHAKLFDSLCELQVIANDILWRHHSVTNKGVPRSMTVEFAEATYRRLLSWAAKLPLDQVRGDRNGHGVILMHVHLHALIVDVFRPFLTSSRRATPLRSFSSPSANPGAICAASIEQLKRLLLIYRLHCKVGLFSALCHLPILYVLNAMVHEATTSVRNGNAPMAAEWQFYLDLCLTGYQSLFGSFRSFGSAAKGILAMALRHGVITARRAERGVRELEELGRMYDSVEDLGDGKSHASWIVDQDLGMIDKEAAAARSFADEFQKLVLDDNTNSTE